jgi:hypothetical protein
VQIWESATSHENDLKAKLYTARESRRERGFWNTILQLWLTHLRPRARTRSENTLNESSTSTAREEATSILLLLKAFFLELPVLKMTQLNMANKTPRQPTNFARTKFQVLDPSEGY